MHGLTASEWLVVLVADCGVAVLGVAVARALIPYGRGKWASALAVAFSFPPIVGFIFLASEWKEDEDCTLICWSAYEAHWVGWSIGWLLAGVVILGAALVVGWSFLRGRRAAD